MSDPEATLFLRLGHPVTETTDRFDAIRRTAELFPHPADVRVHGARIDHILITPHVVEEGIPALHPPAPLDQDAEELEFGGGEFDVLAAHPHLMAGSVQLNFSQGED